VTRLRYIFSDSLLSFSLTVDALRKVMPGTRAMMTVRASEPPRGAVRGLLAKRREERAGKDMRLSREVQAEMAVLEIWRARRLLKRPEEAGTGVISGRAFSFRMRDLSSGKEVGVHRDLIWDQCVRLKAKRGGKQS
jgi:hypothetical protein